MSEQPSPLSIPRTLKIGTFHIGSSFVDLLTSGVLNRILISDLNIWATPVALLSALRYLLAPLGIWAGYRSDTHPIGGLYRLPYIWAGRLPMLLSLPLLPVIAMLLAADPRSPLGWILAICTFLIYGVGTLISGGVFLALVRDTAPPERQGQAISIVQIFLVVSFPVAGIIYGQLMPVYDLETFWYMTLIGMTIAATFFLFALTGAERPRTRATVDETVDQPPFTKLLREIWADRPTRRFFLFLALGATSAFAQDAILEPFGGQVFGLSVGETTRFNAYWGLGVLVSLVATIIITRRRQAHEQVGTTVIGLIGTALPLALLGVVALTESRLLLIPTLFFFGLGFGIYTIGAISLLIAMTADRRAGAYLGLWSVTQLLFRGVGIFLGGFVRDLLFVATGSYTIAYAGVFFLEAVGLLVCVLLIINVDVPGFVRGTRQVQPAASTLMAALD